MTDIDNFFPFNLLNNTEFSSLYDNCEITNSYYNSLLPFHYIRNHALKSLFKSDHYSMMKQSRNYIDPVEVQKQINFKNNFTVLNINVRSLNKNFNKLEILLSQLNFTPSIIIVTETWIDDNRPLLHCLRGYDFINEPANGVVGGAGMFIKSEINYNKLTTLNLNLTACENLWIEISFSANKKLIIGSIYRHPGHRIQDFQDKLLSNIQSFNSHNQNFVIAGDININLMNESKQIENYKNEINSLGTLQLVNNPTRFSTTTNNHTLLDHIYTNLTENKTSTKCILYDISDHIPVITVITERNIKKKLVIKK